MALLIAKNPRIIAFENHWATSTKGVFDFLNPLELFQNKQSPETQTTKIGLII